MKRIFTLALTALLALTLASCAGIPTSGPVKPGSALAETDTSTIEFFPAGPISNATQEQILRGFLEAASGPQNDYAVAKQFLTPEFQSKWDPNAAVYVDTVFRSISMGATSNATASVTSTVSAVIDGTGQYSELATPSERKADYAFARVNDQWRISSAPQGIFLDRSILDLTYRTYPIYFFDPTFRFLVPDVRWFARASSATTRITKALLAGPSAWLGTGNAVVTAFPANTGLVANSVPVIKEVANADFTSNLNAADPVSMTRIKQQLTASLVGVNSVNSVDLFVEGVLVNQGAQAFVETVMPPPVDNRAFVISERGIGYLDGDLVSNSPGFSMSLPTNPAALTLGSGNRFAAALSSDGVTMVRPAANASMLDGRPGLIAPSLDRYNYVWSVPGKALAELLAFTPEGTPSKISVPWSSTSVSAIEVSHDGTRVAILFSDSAGVKLVVASVIRGENGVPLRLGGSVTLPLPPGAPLDIAWADDITVAAISSSGGTSLIYANVIGGRSQILPSFTSGNAVSMAGGNSLNQLRVLSSDGRLYTLRNTSSWSLASTGIKVLGVQQ